MLRRNAGLRVLAILLAVFLWFYRLMTEENPIAEKPPMQLPVAVQDVPADLVVARAPQPVKVTVSGPRNALDSAAEQVHAWVSAAHASVGTHSFPVQVSLPDRLTLVHRAPQRVEVGLERVRKKSFLVEYTVPPGYSVGEPQITPPWVAVSGLSQNVARVAQAIININVTYARLGVARPEVVTAVDSAGDPVSGVTVSPGKVRVSVPITRTQAYATVPVVLRVSGRVAEGYRIVRSEVKPPLVTIAGDATAIKGVTFVETQPLDVKKETGRLTRTVPLAVPQGIQTVGAPQVTVTLEIAKG